MHFIGDLYFLLKTAQKTFFFDEHVVANILKWRLCILQQFEVEESKAPLTDLVDLVFDIRKVNPAVRNRYSIEEYDSRVFIGRITQYSIEENNLQNPKYFWTCCGAKSKHHNPLKKHNSEILTALERFSAF